MRKIFMLIVGMTLICGHAAARCLPSETEAPQSVAPQQVVTLDIVFDTYPDHFQFRCLNDISQYGIFMIDIYIHHVDIYFYDGTVNLDSTAWIQMEGAVGNYSEIVPCRLTPDTYVDLSTIQVTGNPDYIYEFNITGIATR